MPALSHALPEKQAGYVRKRGSKGNNTDEAKVIARKVLNAMEHLTERMSANEERKVLQIQAAWQEALVACGCKKGTRESSATKVPRIGEESRKCRLCRCCSRVEERLKPEYAAKKEGARSAKCVFCGNRLRALWRLQARSSEGSSAPACYGCAIHAAIARSIQEEAAEKEKDEKERGRRKKEEEESEQGKEQGRATAITQQSPVAQAKKDQRHEGFYKKRAKAATQQLGNQEGRNRVTPIDLMNATRVRNTWQEIEKEGTEIGVGTMDTVVERLRQRYGRFHFFAETGTYAGIQRLGIRPSETYRRFRSNRAEKTPQAHYFCPIMTPEHWTLAVVKIGGSKNQGWLLNSLQDAGQRVFTAAVEQANEAVQATRGIAWSRVDCKRQRELECGCRVMLAMLVCCVGLAQGWQIERCVDWCRQVEGSNGKDLSRRTREATRLVLEDSDDCWSEQLSFQRLTRQEQVCSESSSGIERSEKEKDCRDRQEREQE